MILVEILISYWRVKSLTHIPWLTFNVTYDSCRDTSHDFTDFISDSHFPSLLHSRYSYVPYFLFSRLHSVADVVSFAIGLEICIFTFFLWVMRVMIPDCSSLWNSLTLFRINFYLYWNFSQIPEFSSHHASHICTCGIGLLNLEEESVLNVPVALRLFQELSNEQKLMDKIIFIFAQ